MTRQLDVDRLLENWLTEGPSQLPDHVIDGIVRQLDENNQRRSRWLPSKVRISRMILGLGGVAAAVALAFVAVGLYLNGSGVAGPPQPTESPTATGQPTGPPTASPTLEATQLPFSGAIAPGRYFIEFKGHRYTFTVPDRDFSAEFLGWAAYFASFDSRAVVWQGSGEAPNDAGMVIDGNISTLYTEACQWSGSAITPGPTVDDLATALAALEGFDSSEPTDVTLSGYQGKRLQMTAPADLDVESCLGSQYRSFGNGALVFSSPGHIHDVRILDLDGTRLLVVTDNQTGTPAEARAELDRMVDTLEIEPVGD